MDASVLPLILIAIAGPILIYNGSWKAFYFLLMIIAVSFFGWLTFTRTAGLKMSIGTFLITLTFLSGVLWVYERNWRNAAGFRNLESFLLNDKKTK